MSLLLRVGVDEVGRGPLAGPVVACACVLPEVLNEPWISELTDSKALSAKKRDKLSVLLQEAVPYAIAQASVEEIDKLNIREASLLAMHRAVTALAEKVGHTLEVVVDGNVLIPNLPFLQQAVIKADLTVPCVSAASILAKVYRDALMQDLDKQYPGYGWGQNAGYGSATHMAALQTLGATPHHRASFAPVKVALEQVRHAA
jgi:ribonuclease HII